MSKMEEIIQRADAALVKAKETGAIPHLIWKQCKAVAVINCYEAGLILSITQGDGIVMKHNDDGTWGAPSAIGFGGFGAGMIIGKADKMVFIFPMTKLGLDLLAGENSVKLGAKLGVAAGPTGRELEAGASFGTGGVGATHSYVIENGVLLNVGLASTTIVAENKYNQEFYGEKATAEDIINKPDAVTIPEGKGVEGLKAKLAELSA